MQGNLNLNPKPKEQVKELLRDLQACFQATWPSKQFRAELMLGLIQLEIWANEMTRTHDLNKLRELHGEFDHGVEIIKQAMELLWEKVWRPLDHGMNESTSAQEPSRSDSALKIVR